MKHLPRLLLLALILAPGFVLASDIWLTMNRYGPVKIGMSADEAYAHLRSLAQVEKPSVNEGCDYYSPMAGLSFMLDNQKIVRIETSSSKAVTPSGIRVGDRLAKLKATFGHRLDDQPHHYEGPQSRSIKLFSKDRSIAMRFEVREGRIVEIYAGYEHAIHFVEGCA